MSVEKKKKDSQVSWVLIALMVIFLGVSAYIVKMVLSDDSPRRKSSIAMVTLLKPPPVQVKEKPPEPEPVKDIKKEEIVDPTQVNDQPQDAQSQDDTPAGDRLSIDGDGSAGGDSFGLGAKKGGRSILEGGGGGLGKRSLLSKFGGYTQIVETEIRKRVMKQLDEEGGFPKGKLQTIVRVSLDANGGIIKYKIIGSSGNHKMDDAVKNSLGNIKISEPPPDGMPRTMSIKISSQG